MHIAFESRMNAHVCKPFWLANWRRKPYSSSALLSTSARAMPYWYEDNGVLRDIPSSPEWSEGDDADPNSPPPSEKVNTSDEEEIPQSWPERLVGDIREVKGQIMWLEHGELGKLKGENYDDVWEVDLRRGRKIEGHPEYTVEAPGGTHYRIQRARCMGCEKMVDYGFLLKESQDKIRRQVSRALAFDGNFYTGPGLVRCLACQHDWSYHTKKNMLAQLAGEHNVKLRVHLKVEAILDGGKGASVSAETVCKQDRFINTDKAEERLHEDVLRRVKRKLKEAGLIKKRAKVLYHFSDDDSRNGDEEQLGASSEEKP